MRLRLHRPIPAEKVLAALQGGDVQAVIDFHRHTFGDLRMEGEDEDGEDDDDEDEDDNEDDGDSGSAGDSEDKDSKSKRDKELQSENARRRHENKQLKSELDQMKAKLKEFEDKDKSELDKTSGTLQEVTKERDALAEAAHELRIENAFLTSNKYSWVDPQAALKLADLDGVEIDDDGKVTGMAEALEALAKSKPYLLKKKGDDDDDDDDDKGTSRTGQPVGGKKKGNPNRDKLIEKYPALRR